MRPDFGREVIPCEVRGKVRDNALLNQSFGHRVPSESNQRALLELLSWLMP
jgi:hypothetical protein